MIAELKKYEGIYLLFAWIPAIFFMEEIPGNWPPPFGLEILKIKYL